MLYGAAAVVGLSRIVDQRHYFTDVALGAAVGTAVGQLTYALHFDWDGRPRRRHAVSVTPMPGGAAVTGSF